MIPKKMRACAVSAGLLTLLLPSAADARLGDTTLEMGDRGRDVKTAQKLLTRAGIRTVADGVYGRATVTRVKRFERREDLRADGKLSPRDAKVLKAAARRDTAGDDEPTGNGDAPASGDAAKATLSPDGRTAIAPESAPQPVKDAIAAANKITDKPYRYGGGHSDFEDSGYDCSGGVSYALHGADVLDRPLDSSGLMSWGESGEGEWITVYANSGHTYVMIAGLRFDTSGEGEEGPRWRKEARSVRGYTVRHPKGL